MTPARIAELRGEATIVVGGVTFSVGPFVDASLAVAAINAGHCDAASALRADVERLTRELREAREAIRAYTPRCFVCSRIGTKAWAGQRHRYCDAHADTGHSDVECAPAIRAAEKDRGE